MNDPFDPFGPDDPFDPGLSFQYPYDPFLDPSSPFNDPLEPVDDMFGTGAGLYEPLPYPGQGIEGLSLFPGPEFPLPDEIWPEMPLDLTDRLDYPDPFVTEHGGELWGPEMELDEPMDSYEESTPEKARGVHEVESDMPDELEASIEGTEVPPTWPKVEVEDETKAPAKSEYRVMGVSSPDLKITYEPERTYERPFKPRLWRPRRKGGMKPVSKTGKIYSKKKRRRLANREKGYRPESKLCPFYGIYVDLFLCRSCEHRDKGECGGMEPGRICPVFDRVDREICELCEHFREGICSFGETREPE